MLAKIDGARQRLSSPVLQPELGQTLLAVVHLRSGEEQLITVDAAGRSLTRGFTTQLVVKNGINSTYSVSGGWVVVGLKRRLQRGGYIVYAPYSPELDTAEVRKRGKEHLEGVAKAALKWIREHRIRVRATWTDEFMVRTVVCLALIEHIDPGEFKRGTPIATLVGRVLTVVGANQGHAYNHNQSHAGAQGLMQIMPGTYSGIRTQYRLSVPESASAGSRDHTTAMVIAILLNDTNRTMLGGHARLLPAQDDHNICQWLAAAYNCGGGRSLRTLQRFQGQWAQKLHFEEARTYVKKLSAVWKLLFA